MLSNLRLHSVPWFHYKNEKALECVFQITTPAQHCRGRNLCYFTILSAITENKKIFVLQSYLLT